MKTLFKRMLCFIAVAALLFAGTGTLYVQAASNAITVTNALSGEMLYSGNDLQEAMDAAERGSIVSVGRYVTVESSVVVDVEIMLVGYDMIRGLSNTVQILLSGQGAIYVDTRIRSTFIAALHSNYSSVSWTEENNGYIYYLVTQTPSLEGKTLSVTVDGDLFGVKIDEEAGVVYLDGAVSGLSTSALAKLVSMEADNADGVEVSFDGAIKVDGTSCIANGTTMILTADNVDYDGVVSKAYQIVLLGDVNANGRIDAADASLTLRHANQVAELSGLALLAADANNDGAVTAADADALCKKYVRGDYKSSL